MGQNVIFEEKFYEPKCHFRGIFMIFAPIYICIFLKNAYIFMHFFKICIYKWGGGKIHKNFPKWYFVGNNSKKKLSISWKILEKIWNKKLSISWKISKKIWKFSSKTTFLPPSIYAYFKKMHIYIYIYMHFFKICIYRWGQKCGFWGKFSNFFRDFPWNRQLFISNFFKDFPWNRQLFFWIISNKISFREIFMNFAPPPFIYAYFKKMHKYICIF